MKRFFTSVLMSGLLLMSAGLSAQTDITPSRYQFSNLAVGPYSLDKGYPGANPSASDPDVVNNWNDGFTMALNGNIADLTSGQGGILNSYFQILDMGGEVGKVLCMKGSDSTFPYGVAGDPGFWLGWWNLAFYTDPVATPSVAPLIDGGLSEADATKQATVRLRIVFHIHQNVISTTNKLFDILAYTYTGNHKKDEFGALDATQEFKSGDCTKEEFNYETFETEYVYDDTKWIACEYDFVAPEVAGVPLRFTLRMGGNAKNTTLLIKEMTMTVNPTGDPIEKEELTLVSDPVVTAVNDLPQVDPLNYYVANGVLYLRDVEAGDKVTVFSIVGQTISSIVALGSEVNMPLAKGIYIVQAGQKTAKIAVR